MSSALDTISGVRLPECICWDPSRKQEITKKSLKKRLFEKVVGRVKGNQLEARSTMDSLPPRRCEGAIEGNILRRNKPSTFAYRRGCRGELSPDLSPPAPPPIPWQEPGCPDAVSEVSLPGHGAGWKGGEQTEKAKGAQGFEFWLDH